ncbi:MAG: ABC transporter substrate binding protein [Pseudomonadota bacterium]
MLTSSMAKRLLFLLLALTLWGGGPAAAGASGGPVAILLSDSEAAYGQQVTIFSEEIGMPVQVFNLHGDLTHDPGLKEKLFAIRPSLIFALGAKAAYAAKLWTQDRQDIPVLFAMVLNWQRYKLLDGSRNIAGIAAEISPGAQFVNMTMFLPAMRRVGLLYSPLSETILGQAKEAAALLGLEVVAEPVDRAGDFQRAFKRLAGRVDAFWLLNDPVVYTLENMDWLEDRCLKEKLLCVGQTQNLAKMGLALTVNPDLGQIGGQVAAMARNILLHGQKPGEIGVMEPIGTQLFVNLKTAKRIELPVSTQVLDMATAVIR